MAEYAVKLEGEEGGENEVKSMEATVVTVCRKVKRKEMKKMKRKKARKEAAEKEREETEARLNDPEEQRKLKEMEEEQNQRMEKERKEFEDREIKFLEEIERKRKKLLEEEEERRKVLEENEEKEENKKHQVEKDEEDDWEYVEEGPAEIIWQGNEIIVRKKRVKVPKKMIADQQCENLVKQHDDRPTSNPLPPQSEAFAEYQTASTERILENVTQQIPNFGTEQDKAHCPFHLKTGACRFGQRCSRVHFYPDRAHTLLMKSMYNGPGIAWEQDEGLEYTDEEVERCYEEFYEDVHTEFLKYGEIVNFKVCKNSSFHLRGNVYVHYKSLDSALLAYQSFNGRYFAGKQVNCEFVNVTRWKVAICGEYMKSRLKMCSRGTECNFIHCFRNPGGDYEWADWDKPPPRYWIKKMIALFGYSDEYAYEKQMEKDKFEQLRASTKTAPADKDRYQPSRSRSRDRNHSLPCSSKSSDSEDDQKDTHGGWHTGGDRKRSKIQEEKSYERVYNRSDSINHDLSSEGGLSDKDSEVVKEKYRHHNHARKRSRHDSEVADRSRHCSSGKIKDRNHGADSDGGRSKQKKHAETEGSRHRIQKASSDDYRDGKTEFREEDGYHLGGEKHHNHIGKSSKDHSKLRHADDFGDSKKETDKRDHTKRKSSRHRSSSSEFRDDYQDDLYRTYDTDSKDDWLEKNDERHQSHKRRHLRESEGEISDDGGIGGKRLEEKSYNEDDTELEKSRMKRKPVDRHSSKRSHSRRKNSETNSNSGCPSTGETCKFNHADFDSRHKSIEESNEHDRWKPGSPDRI